MPAKILTIIGKLLTALVLITVGVAVTLWYTNSPWSTTTSGGTVPDAPVDQRPSAALDKRTAVTAITGADIEALLQIASTSQRAQILASADSFAAFVEQEKRNRAILAAAYENGLDRDESVATLASRAAEKVILDAYLNKIVRRNVEQDFPNESQALEFYEQNKQLFQLPKRIHLSQIFIPFGSDRDKAGALAERLVLALRDGKREFASVAKAHSKHASSQVNDGYMGLIALDQLLPEVRLAVEKLASGEISDPVQTDNGYHILTRGADVVQRSFTYADVSTQVAARARQDHVAKTRAAALKKNPRNLSD